MILPIVLYGDPILKKKSAVIEPEHEGLKELIDNMFETMYSADGVGLAAPQVGEAWLFSWWTLRLLPTNIPKPKISKKCSSTLK